MRVLFLYTELADYFIKCCDELSKNAEVHVVRWPVNREAPFDFSFSGQITIYNRNDYDDLELAALVRTIDPGLIICSGWIDKGYLRVSRNYFGKIPTVMSCDTSWKGTFRQYLAILLSRLTLIRIFSHAWVPGKSQKQYVQKLGFKSHNIQLGFYSCDLPRFNREYEKRNLSGKAPHRFLYVGRYYEFKGLPELWEAFIQFKAETANDWELWCLGTGDLRPREHPSIRHFGFVQPSDLAPIIGQCGVFVLPSRYEPWGVVVQEYAASGFPLILSDKVGAGEAYLSENRNGFLFKAGMVEALKLALKKVSGLSPKDVNSMARVSHELAQQNSPVLWTEKVRWFYEQGQKK